jgi:hypothetical protein
MGALQLEWVLLTEVPLWWALSMLSALAYGAALTFWYSVRGGAH